MKRLPRGWVSVGSFVLYATRKTDRLAITVAPTDEGTWIALAVASRKPGAKVRSAAQRLEATLEDHAHHSLGTFATPGEAMRVSELYSTTWAKGGAWSPPCDCDEIPAPKLTRKQRSAILGR